MVRLRVFRNRDERGGTMIIFILSELIRVSRVRLRARKRRGKVIERILPRICAPIRFASRAAAVSTLRSRDRVTMNNV